MGTTNTVINAIERSTEGKAYMLCIAFWPAVAAIGAFRKEYRESVKTELFAKATNVGIVTAVSAAAISAVLGLGLSAMLPVAAGLAAAYLYMGLKHIPLAEKALGLEKSQNKMADKIAERVLK